jgi:hypothetical protein
MWRAREGTRPSPLMIAGFIDEQRAAGRGVESVCAVLREQGVQVAPRTYRSWRRAPVPARVVTDAAVIDRLRGLRTGSATGGPLPETLYGRRKMTAWLTRNGFPGVSKHTVDRLMRDPRPPSDSSSTRDRGLLRASAARPRRFISRTCRRPASRDSGIDP